MSLQKPNLTGAFRCDYGRLELAAPTVFVSAFKRAKPRWMFWNNETMVRLTFGKQTTPWMLEGESVTITGALD